MFECLDYLESLLQDIINYGEERRNDHSALVSKLETYAFSAPADDNSGLPDKTGIEQLRLISTRHNPRSHKNGLMYITIQVSLRKHA